MKIAAEPSFWSLRPIATAGRLELTSWVAAVALALALMLTPAPAARTPARTITSTAALPVHLTIYEQHCIERFVTRSAGRSEEYVTGQINRLCIEPIRAKLAAADRHAGLSCGRPFPLQSTPAAKPFIGCLGG
jgi:hypothetical protein